MRARTAETGDRDCPIIDDRRTHTTWVSRAAPVTNERAVRVTTADGPPRVPDAVIHDRKRTRATPRVNGAIIDDRTRRR
jgi:hypothetical protein